MSKAKLLRQIRKRQQTLKNFHKKKADRPTNTFNSFHRAKLDGLSNVTPFVESKFIPPLM